MTTEHSLIDPDAQANRTMAAISYLWILCLVPLIWKRNSKFAQFHAKQGLVLFIAEIIIGLIAIRFIDDILALAAVVFSASGFIKAYNGEWWQAPVIYDLSRKIKL